jgi:hypothetical protein
VTPAQRRYQNHVHFRRKSRPHITQTTIPTPILNPQDTSSGRVDWACRIIPGFSRWWGMHTSALIRRRFYLYQLRDDFRDRRDFITGRPNYVGGYEEWLARKASLETGVQNPIEQDDMTRPWRNGGAWRRSNSAQPGRGSNPNRNNSQNNSYRRDSSPNYGQYGPAAAISGSSESARRGEG